MREHNIRGLTRGVCPECRRVVDAQILLRDGALYLRKFCPEHGWHEALVLSDADWALQAQRLEKPGAIPHSFATDLDRGCPHDCVLCPEHQQHTGVGLVEVTNRCNLGCPICLADAGGSPRFPGGYDLTLRQVEAILDRFVEAEGRPEVVQISGGEPTLHPQLLDILAAAKARDIRHVMLNTNGLRIAQDPDLVERLACYAPSIYLQFDGLSDSTHRTLRGRDLRAIKRRALDHLSCTGMTVVLVATVAQGVNDGELGDILRYGLEHPAVLGDVPHPGGLALTCQLGEVLALGPGDRVLDVACGRGASAVHLAEQLGCHVIGLDYGADTIAAAEAAATESAAASLTSFRQGDAEDLPFDSGTFDAVISECSFCTFPQKGVAAREMARVLAPRGRLCLTDITVDGPLPDDIQTLLSWVACVAGPAPQPTT